MSELKSKEKGKGSTSGNQLPAAKGNKLSSEAGSLAKGKDASQYAGVEKGLREQFASGDGSRK